MERVCRTCGQTYRGLVCQACHPRTKKRGERQAEIVAGFGSAADVASAADLRSAQFAGSAGKSELYALSGDQQNAAERLNEVQPGSAGAFCAEEVDSGTGAVCAAE
jgi:hypothetical protein